MTTPWAADAEATTALLDSSDVYVVSCDRRPSVSLKRAITQTARLAAFVESCKAGHRTRPMSDCSVLVLPDEPPRGHSSMIVDFDIHDMVEVRLGGSRIPNPFQVRMELAVVGLHGIDTADVERLEPRALEIADLVSRACSAHLPAATRRFNAPTDETYALIEVPTAAIAHAEGWWGLPQGAKIGMLCGVNAAIPPSIWHAPTNRDLIRTSTSQVHMPTALAIDIGQTFAQSRQDTLRIVTPHHFLEVPDAVQLLRDESSPAVVALRAMMAQP